MDIAERAASELNHHIAGLALILIALLIFAGMVPRFRSVRYAWPVLFIGLALFLAAWSDAEIWPRGNLSWSWLIHHDAEARQHKIYALLLLGLGVVEFLRARGTLNRTWQRWAFPVLAIGGVALLTMHAHGGTSGIAPPSSPSLAVAAEVPQPSMSAHHHHDGHMSMAEPAIPAHEDHAASAHAGHVMDASMIKVKREHLWMTVVGLALALFKFLADSPRSRRILHVAWPTAMACLGLLLVFYRE